MSQAAGCSLPGDSHQHDPQLEEVVVFWILHLHHSPGVQAAPYLLPLGLDLLVGPHHCKWDASLGKRSSPEHESGVKVQPLTRRKGTLKGNPQSKGVIPVGAGSHLSAWFGANKTLLRGWEASPVYLEDPGLLFEILVLVRLCVRKVVNLDTVFIDLIQNLWDKTQKFRF